MDRRHRHPDRRALRVSIGALAVVVAAVVLASCAAPAPAPSAIGVPLDHSAPRDPAAACACPVAVVEGGWCRRCGVGHIAAVRIESANLFDYLDEHGHDVEPDRFECATCRDALRTDGSCDACGYGFVNGKAYMSRLTWLLARGAPRGPDTHACPECRANAGGTGWCTTCGTGFVGHVAYDDRSVHAAALEEYERLRTAVGQSCETCAIMQFTGGTCRVCGRAPAP